jgi:hypothetical protein
VRARVSLEDFDLDRFEGKTLPEGAVGGPGESSLPASPMKYNDLQGQGVKTGSQAEREPGGALFHI